MRKMRNTNKIRFERPRTFPHKKITCQGLINKILEHPAEEDSMCQGFIKRCSIRYSSRASSTPPFELWNVPLKYPFERSWPIKEWIKTSQITAIGEQNVKAFIWGCKSKRCSMKYSNCGNGNISRFYLGMHFAMKTTSRFYLELQSCKDVQWNIE